MPKLSLWIARISLAFCFLSFGIWEVVDPHFWSGYVPPFVSAIVAADPLVFVHGIILSMIGIGVLTGYRPKLWTGFATLMLFEITVSIGIEEGFTSIFIRDAALLGFAGAMFAETFSSSRR